jgi:hypothetical protein
MTAAAPTSIPVDERGAPDLQLLVRQLGQAAAKARGEEYDPRNKREHGGYQYITPAIWKAFDAAMATYQQAHRAGLAPASSKSSSSTLPSTDAPVAATSFGPVERDWPYVRCENRSAEARFGYRNSDGAGMRWYCFAHGPAKYWADARREITGASR